MEKNYTQHLSNIYNTIPQMMAQEISSSDANNKVLATAAIYQFRLQYCIWGRSLSHKVHVHVSTHSSTWSSYQTNQNYATLKLSYLYQNMETEKNKKYWGNWQPLRMKNSFE